MVALWMLLQDLYKLLCAEGTSDLSAEELCNGVSELKGNAPRPISRLFWLVLALFWSQKVRSSRVLGYFKWSESRVFRPRA